MGLLSQARTNQDYRKEVLAKLFNVFASERKIEWIRPETIRPLQVGHRIDEFKSSDGWVVFCGMDFSQGDDLHDCNGGNGHERGQQRHEG